MDKQSFDEHWPPVMEGLDFANKDNLGQLETDKKSWGGRLVGLPVHRDSRRGGALFAVVEKLLPSIPACRSTRTDGLVILAVSPQRANAGTIDFTSNQ
ncbi:hypothetical protein PO002_11030 [Cupriavidus necator]|uniref:hypothetical protein n=1 Tax=Cupriavidus necator TaxID=106590 RepID=UPI0039C14524